MGQQDLVKYFQDPAPRHGVLVVPSWIVGQRIAHELCEASPASQYHGQMVRWPNGSSLYIVPANRAHEHLHGIINIDVYFIWGGSLQQVEDPEYLRIQLDLATRRSS